MTSDLKTAHGGEGDAVWRLRWARRRAGLMHVADLRGPGGSSRLLNSDYID